MDYEKAASFWEEKDKEAAPVEREALMKEMEKFIESHNTCALASGCEEFIRCTPIEYSYIDGKFWILSEGGMKFKALQRNRKVCLAIFDSYTGFGNLGGMQAMGSAEAVEPWSGEYLKLLAFRKMQEENVRKLPHPLYLIKITPCRIDFLWSGFQKMGFSPRQSIVF